MSQKFDASTIIEMFDLVPLPDEGGFYRQSYSLGDTARPSATAIYYLITPDSFSSLHRLTSDEIFHFYAGDSCQMIQVGSSGDLTDFRLGSEFSTGDRPQIVVPAGTWQGTKLVDGGSWALVGTTMTPGYRQEEFELATPATVAGFSEDVRLRVASFLPG
jgi:predicted cupin superfamily sugar epimerase